MFVRLCSDLMGLRHKQIDSPTRLLVWVKQICRIPLSQQDTTLLNALPQGWQILDMFDHLHEHDTKLVGLGTSLDHI